MITFLNTIFAGRVMRVAIQGEKGSYSDEAASKFFGDYEAIYSRFLEEVFDSVTSGEASYGVIPVENSTTGSIRKALDLLLENDVRVVGEVKIKIRHALLSVKGAKLEDIKVVYSHPEAISQCEGFLRSREWTVIPSFDTAGAAREVAKLGDRSKAAIAGEHVADIYNLDILARDIQDLPHNTTRFFVMGRQDSSMSEANTTSLFFATRHAPGALWRALGAFARRNINLLWLESRPIRKEPWNYSFFVEFEGSLLDENVKEALKELKDRTLWLKILGSYKREEEKW